MSPAKLMIWDWVSVEGKIGQVSAITDITVGVLYKDDTYAVVMCDKINPIPLTPEILEKNGCKLIKTYGTEKYIYEQVSVNLYHRDLWLLKVDMPYNFDCTYIPFKFINELQHALRLLNIEKEIQL